MGFDRIRIKENAKLHYQNNKWNNVLVILIFTLLTDVGSSISYKYSGGDRDILLVPILFAVCIGFAVSIFAVNIITMGTITWFQKAIHTEKLGVEGILSAFKTNYLDNVITLFLRNLFVVLWSMLFVIPGIVKAYSYSLTEYIKSENPSISPSRAIELSKIMTKGKKGDLFVLDLSFLGWFILSAFTMGILMVLYVGPYYYAARAFAYEEIKAEAIANGTVSASELTA